MTREKERREREAEKKRSREKTEDTIVKLTWPLQSLLSPLLTQANGTGSKEVSREWRGEKGTNLAEWRGDEGGEREEKGKAGAKKLHLLDFARHCPLLLTSASGGRGGGIIKVRNQKREQKRERSEKKKGRVVIDGRKEEDNRWS